MNLFDASLMALAMISVVAGALRGFVKELVALAGWVLAVVLVMRFSVQLGRSLPFDAGPDGVRTAICAILIVLVCVVGANLAGRLLRAAMSAARLAGPDRALGALFGLVRAAAVWLLIAVVVIHLGLSQRPFWKTSRLAPWLEAALRLVSPELGSPANWPATGHGV